MMYRTILVLLTLLHLAYSSQLSIVTFPFKNESPSSNYDWIGAALPEMFSRKAYPIKGLQIWDPVFLFQVDSTGYQMTSDSLLMVHRNRWQWDAAIGGKYFVRNDTVQMISRIIWAVGKEEPLKMEVRYITDIGSLQSLLTGLVFKTLSLVKFSLSSADSAFISESENVKQEAFRTYLAGYGFEMRHNYNAAMTAYARAMEIDPHFGLASSRLATIYKQSGNRDMARNWFDKAVSSSPKNPMVIAEAANFFVDSDLLSEASDFISSNKKELEKTASGLKAIGNLFLAEGGNQRAIATLTKALSLKPSDLDIEFSLGMAYLSSGEFVMAIDFFNRLIKSRPDYLRFYSSLGAAYRKAGKLMESSMVLESAMAIEPENTTILIELAHTYFNLTWYQKSAQLLQLARELNPNLGEALVNLGAVYWHLERKDEAVALFKEASRKSVLYQPAMNNTGNVFFLSNDFGKAIRAYRKAYKFGKKNPVVLFNLANAYYLKGKFKKASSYFDELLSLSPGRVDILLKQAEIAAKLRKNQDAQEYLMKVLDILPYHEDALRAIVNLFVSEKKFEEAIKPVEAYLDHMPNSKEFMLLLAKIYRDLGWYEVAVMKYQFLIRDYPEDPQGYLGVGLCRYDMIRYKDAQNYEDAIYVLKLASQYDPGNPESDIIIGDIYMYQKGFSELAAEHWGKALAKATSPLTKKTLQEKIRRAEKK